MRERCLIDDGRLLARVDGAAELDLAGVDVVRQQPLQVKGRGAAVEVWRLA